MAEEPRSPPPKKPSPFAVEIPPLSNAHKLSLQKASSRTDSSTLSSLSAPSIKMSDTSDNSQSAPTSRKSKAAPLVIDDSEEEELDARAGNGDDAMEVESDEDAATESVYEIVSRAIDDGEASYKCKLVEGGKIVKRSEEEMQEQAPKLLARWKQANSPTKITLKVKKQAVDLTADSSDVDSAPAKRSTKGKGKAVEDDDEEEVSSPSEDEGGEDGDENGDVLDSEEEDSEDASEEDSESSADGDSDDDDDDAPRRSSRAKKTRKPKSPKKSSRRSGRSTRFQKTFDLGDSGAVDSGVESEAAPVPTRASTRSTRATRADMSRGASVWSEDDSGAATPKENGTSGRRRKKAAQDDQDFVVFDDEDEEDELDLKGEDDEIKPQDQHRSLCVKCGWGPTEGLLLKLQEKRRRSKGRKKRRDELEDDTDEEEARITRLGAWMECGVCITASHFGCLPGPVQKDFVNALKADHELAHQATHAANVAASRPTSVPPTADGEQPMVVDGASEIPLPPLPKRDKTELDPSRTFVVPKCGSCKKQGGRRCFVCGISGRKPAAVRKSEEESTATENGDKMEIDAAPAPAPIEPADDATPPLMFRCIKCKRPSHYDCLPRDDDDQTMSLEDHATSYLKEGECHQCWSYKTPLDLILAWAKDDTPAADTSPDDGDAENDAEVVFKTDEKTGKVFAIPSAKDPTCQAKYLVKWQGAGYRQLDWVPHAYLAAVYQAKLTNFLAKGSQVSFEAPKDDIPEDGEVAKEDQGSAPLPDPNAMDRIPVAWSTVDRILEVWYEGKRGDAVRYEDYKNLPDDPEESIKLVMECYFKWGDLPYASSTYEAPPEADDPTYPAYVKAYSAFLKANSKDMIVPTLNTKQLADVNKARDPVKFKPLREQPDYISGGKLMPFQMDGVNFMYFQWWKKHGCILADEMGLGKTVQIITFLSVLNKNQGSRPFLVSVPNSTIGNWVREFEKWAPHLRVVPYGGDAASRQIVENFELFDRSGKQLKTHVVLATYEALEKNIAVFRRIARWDTLVVDEGQRLKGGTSGLLYNALQSLNIGHRVLLSGTPLNNNIPELFALLHFIDPDNWGDVDALTEEYADLTPEKVEKIRNILKPYFLRRTKELVLQLPPLTEIIVPVTMTTLQRELYRNILERNATAIQSIFHKSASKSKAKKSNFNNILMELRKILCHPYLLSEDIEPKGLDKEKAFISLREASAKLVLLAKLLPKLRANGHRVLIFSQFKITLNILEDFLSGLNMPYLRLDGDTAQLDRQRGIDAYQKPDSEYFAYILSTRAGGVGINLTTADTVIMYDQDFNPHQDLQAIARAHRIGQKKPVRVFKLMVKGTCEERIFKAGTRKLGLDHLIVQRLNKGAEKDDDQEIESILQFGSKELFDESAAAAQQINYQDEDVDALLSRSAEPVQSEKKEGGAATFAHARIWEVQRNGLAEVEVEAEEEEEANDHDFWAGVIQEQEAKARAAKAAAEANAGRGKRTRQQVTTYAIEDPATPHKPKKKVKGSGSDQSPVTSEDDYRAGAGSDDSDDDFAAPPDKEDRLLAGGGRGRKSVSHSNSPAPNSGAPSKEADQSIEIKRKNRQRRHNIDRLIEAAKEFEDDELKRLLRRARASSGAEQVTLTKQATARIQKHVADLKALPVPALTPRHQATTTAPRLPVAPPPKPTQHRVAAISQPPPPPPRAPQPATQSPLIAQPTPPVAQPSQTIASSTPAPPPSSSTQASQSSTSYYAIFNKPKSTAP